MSLQAKAKSERSFRFYSLWDKVCREDVLAEAYRRCRRNGGAPGVDDERFADIDSRGVDTWLQNLREELAAGSYRSKPLLPVESHVTAGACGENQSTATRLGWLFQPRPSPQNLSGVSELHAPKVAQMVDASTRKARHRVPSIPRRVFLQKARPLQAAVLS